MVKTEMNHKCEAKLWKLFVHKATQHLLCKGNFRKISLPFLTTFYSNLISLT